VRVGILAPTAWRVPPRHYGPWELFASLLTEGLVQRGVDVTLFATGDSQTSAKLVSVMGRGYAEVADTNVKVWESLHISEALERAGEFDLLHNSFDYLPLTYSALVATPMLTTIHGFSSESILPVYQKYNGRTHYVAVSDADRHPTLDYLATIHHGIDTDAFALHALPGTYLLFFGRICEEKGTAEAIAVARRVGRPLVMAGIIADQKYFDEQVAPHIDGTAVRYLGPVGPADRKQVLGKAYALLHLIAFDEPFGFSVVESMASGTPVIAFQRGSMAELVRHGENGFLVQNADEAVDALAHVGDLDRRAVHRDALARFSRDRMVDEYLEAYHRILGGPSQSSVVSDRHTENVAVK
jgi:glycosyltransferase involved in cell wall biosynthesis